MLPAATRMPCSAPPRQVRVLRAKKRAAPAVTSAGAGAASAEQAAPAGTSWYWGSYAAGHGLAAGDDLPPNVDGAALQPLLSHLPFSFRYSRWSEEEQQRLRDGVLQLAQVRRRPRPPAPGRSFPPQPPPPSGACCLPGPVSRLPCCLAPPGCVSRLPCCLAPPAAGRRRCSCRR
jgi:hypothetical protein